MSLKEKYHTHLGLDFEHAASMDTATENVGLFLVWLLGAVAREVVSGHIAVVFARVVFDIKPVLVMHMSIIEQ